MARALDPAYRRIDVEEFLAMDFGDAKAELDDGLIYMMAGGNEAHSRIAVNLIIALGVQLRRTGCRPYNSDFAVRTGERSVRFPDVSIYCDNPSAPENRDKQLLADPRVIIEVLSPSTSSLDQTVKRDEYLGLPGVTDLVFVDPIRECVRHVRRTGDEWLEPGADLVLASIGVTVPHAEIFADDWATDARAHKAIASALPLRCDRSPAEGGTMRMRWTTILAALPLAAGAQAPALRPDQAAFRAIYRELVETNTGVATGSCTALAAKIGARFKAAGFADDRLTYFSVPEHPNDGGLVIIYPGTSPIAKPMLLLGHIDVVEARRADWTRDPFTMVEEEGYFYGRGTADMKAMDAIWIDALLRFKAQGYKPKRTIKLALTCGEETTGAFDGAEWLAKNKPDLIAAEFALNEGGGGRSGPDGKPMTMSLHVGEKIVQNYRIEATNPGGHSSVPIRDNAIYELADALAKLRDHEFPLQLSDTTRAFFARAGAAQHDETGGAMIAIAKDGGDKAAEAVLNRDRSYHSMLRTTCVATLLDGGHANNALPQRAGANVNCRIFPGNDVEKIRGELAATIADPRMTVTLVPPIRPAAVTPPLTPKIVQPAEKLVAKYFPGVPLIPTMSTGGTDGIYLEAIGIPVYGPPGLYNDPESGAHGLNEHIRVEAVYKGRDFLTELIRLYADAG